MHTVKISQVSRAAAGVLFTVCATCALGTPIAHSDTDVQSFLGQQAKVVDGNVVQGWTITALKPSSDAIPYAVRGTLWEATATDAAIQGTVIPLISNLNARAQNGENYRVLFGVATPQGVNPSTLGEGETTTGKIYFDVTGAEPTSVAYNDGNQDLATWVTPPPSAASNGGNVPASASSTAPPASGSAASAATTPPASVAPGSQAALPAAGSQGTPLPAGSQGTPLTAGGESAVSQGTPAPTVSAGTPAPPANQGTPLPATANPAAASPVPAATAAPAAPAETSAPASTAAAPSAGGATPAATPTPAPTTPAVPQGSSGTPAS